MSGKQERKIELAQEYGWKVTFYDGEGYYLLTPELLGAHVGVAKSEVEAWALLPFDLKAYEIEVANKELQENLEYEKTQYEKECEYQRSRFEEDLKEIEEYYSDYLDALAAIETTGEVQP